MTFIILAPKLWLISWIWLKAFAMQQPTQLTVFFKVKYFLAFLCKQKRRD